MRTPPDQVRATLVQYIRSAAVNPDVRAYIGPLAEQLSLPGRSRLLWLVEHVADLAGIHPGDRVLDIGCGFGHHALALSLLRGCTVVANDIRETMTGVIDERIGAMRQASARVETLPGDICTLPLAPDSFDAMVCFQAIEHVHDLDVMFAACFRALKPGGRLIATNDNNALNHRQIAASRRMWAQRDRSWKYIAELKRERPIENAAIEPYAAMRERIVRSAAPGLDNAAVERIVAATAGMVEDQIADIARRYAPAMPLPTPSSLSPCRNPVTGEFCERQLDPFDTAAMLGSAGFQAQVQHGFRRRPLSSLNTVSFRPLNRALFNFSPFFVLVAAKPRSAKTPAPVVRTRQASSAHSPVNV